MELSGMSYIRWGTEGSDVYVYGEEKDLVIQHNHPILVCCYSQKCLDLGMPYESEFGTYSEMIEYLEYHQSIGQVIPQNLLVSLK
jgi:hypothetical protein